MKKTFRLNRWIKNGRNIIIALTDIYSPNWKHFHSFLIIYNTPDVWGINDQNAHIIYNLISSTTMEFWKFWLYIV